MKIMLQAVDIKVFVLALSIVISNAVTIFLYLKNRKFTLDSIYSERLFKIQDISFNNPHLEDKNFIEGWDSFCKKHKAKEIADNEDSYAKKYLQYEQYCEMIFNLISDTYGSCKSEKKTLDKVAFKDWARIHEMWWNNPLDEHSNHDTYSKNVCDMVDGWMK